MAQPGQQQAPGTSRSHSEAFTIFVFQLLYKSKVCSQHLRDAPPQGVPLRGARRQRTGCFFKELINDVAYIGGSANE